MNQERTFDENSLESITQFATELCDYDDSTISNNFILFNIRKAVNTLKLLNENEYKNEKTTQLLRLVQNSVFFNTRQNIEDIIQSGLFRLYRKLTDYYLTDGNWCNEALIRIFLCLNTLMQSLKTVTENIHNHLIENAVCMLDKVDFISRNRLTDDVSLCLYDRIIAFIWLNSMYQAGNDKLNELGVPKLILKHLEKLNIHLKMRYELKYIKLRLVLAINSLLTKDEINHLRISNDIVDILVEMFQRAIDNSRTNGRTLMDTRYYFEYTINYNTTYVQVKLIIKQITKQSVNDLVKQKLYRSNVLRYLEEMLERGNEDEKEASFELISILCSIDSVKSHIRNNYKMKRLVNEELNRTSNNEIKSFCMQINDLLNESANSSTEFTIFTMPVKKRIVIEDSKNPVTWDLSKTSSWFRSNNLNNILNVFPNCTGKTLKGLWFLKQKDYIQFTHSVETEIENSLVKVSLQEKVDFYELLDELFM